MSVTHQLETAELVDFEPLAQRALAADPDAFIRFRRDGAVIAAFVTLPYDVIAGRTISTASPSTASPSTASPSTASPPTASPSDAAPSDAANSAPAVSARVDVTYAARDFLTWAGGSGSEPSRRDAHWLSALPPRTGWQRVDVVPEPVIRELVRTGADLARSVTARNAQESLLSSTVLTLAGVTPVEVPLRALAALTSMGFLPHDSQAKVDVAPGWLRVAAPFGSAFVADISTVFNLSAL